MQVPLQVDMQLEPLMEQLMALGAKVDDLPGKLVDIPNTKPEPEPEPTPVDENQKVISSRLEEILGMLELVLSKLDHPDQEPRPIPLPEDSLMEHGDGQIASRLSEIQNSIDKLSHQGPHSLDNTTDGSVSDVIR